MNFNRPTVAPFGVMACAVLLAFASFGIATNNVRAEEIPVVPVEVNDDSSVDLSITKIADTHAPNVGDEVTYTIEVTNEGSNNVAEFTVADTLPSGMSFVSASPAESSLDPLSWGFASLPMGETVTIYVTVRIEEGTEGTELVNTASVYVDGDSVDDNASNDSDSDTLSVNDVVEEDEHTDTEGQCEFEGHKYDETGTPLMDWVIGLMKFVTYEVDNTSDSFILDEEATDADGYYCLETNGYDGTYDIEGSYSFVYKIYEILEDGWENVSVEMGTNEDVENNTLTIVVEDDITESETDFVGDGERGVQKIITVDVSEENGYIFADAAFHVDFYNQETDGGNGGNETEEDTYKIFGYVWHDKNENDVWEKEGENLEEDLTGWTVTAVNGTDVRTTTTDENGRYEFNVPAGTWTINEQLQSEWNQTLPDVNGYTVVVPAVPEVPVENIVTMIRSFLIPTAFAATISEHGPYDFGVIFKGCVTNCGSSNGGSSGGSGGRKGSKSSSSDTNDDPEGEVLGESTSVLPTGAPDTGFGGTAVSPIASLIALFGMIMSLGLLRRATHVK